MVNIQLLKERGIDPEGLKRIYTAKRINDRAENARRRMWSRAQDGIDNNCKNFRFYYAVDLAWDAPFADVTPTLLKTFADRIEAVDEPNREKILNVVKDFGLQHSIITVTDDKTGKKARAIDLPAFFEITIPVVRSYVIARAARLSNDRDLYPFLKFEPMRLTEDLRLKCEILTDRVQVMAAQVGLPAVRRQAIIKMLLYGTQFKVIRNEWHTEEQLDPYGIKYVASEGLLYDLPHPTRVYWDQAHSVYSFLTDTGAKFMGHWKIMRYGDVKDNEMYWNRDKVAPGRDWINLYPSYFSTVYPCVLSFPKASTTVNSVSEQMSLQYISNEEDAACTVVEHFERMIPKDNGLGDYEYPVWFRVVFAGDGTIIYMAPLPSCPVIPYADIVDDGRIVNASFAMELLPFQDMIGNQMSQIILSSRQNLSGITWYDENIITEKNRRALENTGEQFFRSRKFMPYDGRRLRAAQNDIDKAVRSVGFPPFPVEQSISVLNVLLNILERVAQISAQEVGGSASHEQSATEVTKIHASTNSRLSFTGTPIDWATDAWKRQIYNYLMNYGEEEVWANLPEQPQLTYEKLNQLGFTVEQHTEIPGRGKFMVVRGGKQQLKAQQLEYFASTRDNDQRIDRSAMAGAMSQVVQAIFKSPMLEAAIGQDQAIRLMNIILEYMGLPKDFKLVNTGQLSTNQMEKIAQVVMQQVMQQVDKGIQPLVDSVKKQALAIEKIVQILNIGENNAPSPANQLPNGGSQEAEGTAQPMQPPVPAPPMPIG